MKLSHMKILSVTALLLAGAAMFAPVRAENAGQLILSPENRVWLEGDSTLHPYHSQATQVTVAGEAAAVGSLSGLFQPGAVKNFEFSVFVKGLKSGKGALDGNMYKALKADEHPNIIFRLMKISAAPGAEGVLAVTADGTLTVAGQTKDVTLDAEARTVEGRLHISGKEDLLMTDFGIKPPSMMMGTIKTKDEVVIHYDIFVGIQPQNKTGGNNHE